MRHRHPRWMVVVIATAAAGAVTGLGVSAMAAPGTAPSNYRGPARPSSPVRPASTHQSTATHQSNYRGPARNPANIAAVPARHSNLPKKGSN
jgi:hypothetical protein